ncbi:hypothetical protein HNP84_003898 [Thermocatellispora tengchongensis]|uniref:Uncharacterized protein n=1 Tax=Thermocatellispora tengchongensis TaxID=1073253 RepID=A0A840P484_9ACTN|nr:hypothetical protein [Thermocatellispora tengchongensis]MBB5134172.1 hypothetical protein [Thermocatellispora tengchongensis]
MTVRGKPEFWLGIVGASLPVGVLLGIFGAGVFWPVAVLVAVVAMTLAVVRAYQDAARSRPD